MPRHIVEQGESIISLSKRYGIPVAKIWDHPDNRSLRGQGRKTSILYPGDVVAIPDRESRTEPGATEQRHRFRCRGRSTWLRLRFLRRGEPRGGEAYLLTVDGQEFRGNLDDDGNLEVRVPADAQRGILILGDPRRGERIPIRIGSLDPAREGDGVRERLRNLGFLSGTQSDPNGERLRAALRRFQAQHDLEATGEADDATRDRLVELHRS